MNMKSKTTTAVGLVAACAASATTSTATPLSSSSSSSAVAASCSLLHHRSSLAATPSLLGRIPRGGHSPTAEAETISESSSGAATKDGEKKRKKKKKSSKQTKTASSSKTPKAETDSEHAETNTTSSNSPLPPAAQSILLQSCHYDVLGITQSATQIEIQKAYRRRCVLTHPDKTQGDRSAFDKVSEAYDVLSCERKRAVYDKFGKDGLEGGNGDNANGGSMGRNNGGAFGGGSSFFGNDVFRDLFGADPFFGRRQSSSQSSAQQQQQQGQNQNPFRRSPPRNRDLRYQLEVTLEELYSGTTKHVAIQQPNPLRPHFPYRKEVEVTLSPGMNSGQNVRLSGVVDSIPDAAPADVIFLIRERRHPLFSRRGHDLAMEVKISYGESIVGFKRRVRGLDGREFVIGSPFVRRVVKREELVDVPDLPAEEEDVAFLAKDDAVDDETVLVDENNDGNSSTNATNATSVIEAITEKEGTTTSPPVEQIIKTTTISYELPPSIIQSGDVHVLKGHGMPKTNRGGHSLHDHDQQHGDLYVQYIVEMPGSPTTATNGVAATNNKGMNADNLSPEERVDLARLLSKLEGSEDPTSHVVVRTSSSSSSLDGDATISSGADDAIEDGDEKKKEQVVHHLAMASASDFGRIDPDENDHDEHLHHDDDDNVHGGNNVPHDMNDFIQRAFTGRTSGGGFGGPFGGGTGGAGGGFHYFSSSGSNVGGGYNGSGVGGGYHNNGEEEDHKVECNQM